MLDYATFVHSKLKDPDKAENILDKCLNLNPNDITVLLTYILFLFESKRDKNKLEKLMEKVQKINPSLLNWEHKNILDNIINKKN